MRGNVGKVAQTLGPLRLDHDELAKLRPLGQSRKAEVDHFSRAPKSLAGSALHEVAANWAVPTCLHRSRPSAGHAGVPEYAEWPNRESAVTVGSKGA